MENGWIKLYRCSIGSRVFNNEGLLKVWIWCLLKANHSTQWVNLKTGKGSIEVECKEGQFIYGRNSAALELKMSPETVRTRMNKLKTIENITIESTKQYSIITIMNWGAYQTKEINDTNQNTKQTPAKHQANTTNKNVKNDNNEKKETVYRIFEFWNSQGITKHKSVDKMESSINAAIKEYPEDEIKKAMINYKTILNNSSYYWTHKWTLKEFLQRGLDKFRDENKPFDNYKADKKGGSGSGKHTGLNEKDYSEGIGEDGSF